MKIKGQYNGDYKNQLLEYAQFLVKEKLSKKGKYIEDKKPIYVIYARKSTKGKSKGKERQERSIKDQVKACQQITNSLKVRPLHIFKEEESAKKAGKRDDFYKMLDWIKKGRCNSIIAYHPDRLARNMKDAGEIIDLLDRGIIVDLKFSQYHFVNDANGVMTLAIQFALAKQYSDNLSAVSQRGSINIAKEGKAPTKMPKYGYKLNSQGYFRPDGENFDLLKQSFKLALGKAPLEEIADFLNENSFYYKGKKTKMSKQKLSGVFQDTFYAGLYLYGPEVIELKKVDPVFEPMVTPLEFLQLRQSLKDKYSFRRTAQAKTIIFSKMVFCGYCGNLMSPGKSRSSGKSRYRYLTLRCNKKDCQSRFDKTIERGLRGKVIFDYILELLASGLEIDRATYEAYRKEGKNVFQTKRQEFVNQLKSISRQITEIDKTIETKTNALANAKGKLIDRLNKQIEDLTKDKQLLKEKKKNIQENIISIDHSLESQLVPYKNFLNFFKNISNTIKTSNNRYLVDKIFRMMFLNFTVKNQKVVSHQLNPNFEKFVKIPSVQRSRGTQTRTGVTRTPCVYLTSRLCPENYWRAMRACLPAGILPLDYFPIC